MFARAAKVMATTLRQSKVQRFSCAVPTSFRMDRDVAYWPKADMIIASCIVGFSKQSGYANFLNKFLLRFLKPVGSHNSYSAAMPRPRCRVCLQDGIKLDLNDLARKSFIKFGANRGIVWSSSSERQIASGRYHRRHDRPKPCLAPNSDRPVRAAYNFGISQKTEGVESRAKEE